MPETYETTPFKASLKQKGLRPDPATLAESPFLFNTLRAAYVVARIVLVHDRRRSSQIRWGSDIAAPFRTAVLIEREREMQTRFAGVLTTTLVVTGTVLLCALHSAQAARLVSGPNFPVGGVGCAMIFDQPAPPGTQVFLDTGCVFWPNNEWAIGAGGLIINSAKADDGRGACLDEASATAGAAVVVNPCARGAGLASQRWEVKPAPRPSFGITLIVNVKSKLCLDTKSTGELVQLFVNDCSPVAAGGQNWQIK
jgi:hypothetical protein